MKTRRHHNNRGERQIRRGKTRRQVEHIARRLRVPYGATDAPSGYDLGDVGRAHAKHGWSGKRRVS